MPRKYAHTGNDISIGTGVTWPISLNIKGETLGHVHYGVHFLERPEVYKLGESMIVIGAGNVAMDVARGAFCFGRRGARGKDGSRGGRNF